MSVKIAKFALLAILSFLCEYVDSTLGMGYGTTLSPLLMIMGLDPRKAVAAILFSEFLTGLTAGALHHELGNVTFSTDSRDLRVALVLSACSVLGAVVAVFTSLSLPRNLIKLYIGLIVAAMGLLIASGRRAKGFSWQRILALGVVASFNKAISGGGYGPLIVSGQILSGIEGKRAVGITSLAEGLTCAVGLATYAWVGGVFDVRVAGALAVGALSSTPLAAYSVSKFKMRTFERSLGLLTLVLGILTVVRAVSTP
ncbi:MAG: sulfite exporter TauE/SafE family protein [Candidatus Korarchaeota archaeon]|nr:sulfite exporter TauE/SafE family protein [Candidatus Korarchaeota archaeon]